MDKFDSIRAFTYVVEEGGFAAAARKMQMSRSAVNKLVINLENQLKVQLLYRTTRKVTPTDAGTAYYQRCIGILADLEEADLAVAQQHSEPKGTLKINVDVLWDFFFRFNSCRFYVSLRGSQSAINFRRSFCRSN